MFRILRTATILGVAALAGPAVSAQDSTAARAKAVELSRAWAAIGAGDYARAEQVASALVKRYPADHLALAASVAATVGAAKPTAALDSYEQWLTRTREEDVYLLQSIAAGTLAAIGGSADAGLAVEALSKLAASDPDAARGALGRRTDAGPAFDAIRATLGDKAALTRVIETLSAPTSREKLVALRSVGGIKGIPASAIAPLLTDPAPPVRAAAIELLARSEGAGAVGSLTPLLGDPDPFVQATAAVALGREGDPAALDVLNRMLGSDAGDSVAMAATVLKARGVDVSGAADRILADPNPLTRLGAIPFLSDPARAQDLLTQAASDPNPVVRARATTLIPARGNDLASLRRLLRDPNPEVRIGAAESLLRSAGGAAR